MTKNYCRIVTICRRKNTFIFKKQLFLCLRILFGQNVEDGSRLRDFRGRNRVCYWCRELIHIRIELGNDRIAYPQNRVYLHPSSRRSQVQDMCERYICCGTSWWRGVNNPAVSQRVATAGWIAGRRGTMPRCLYRSKAPRGSAASSKPRPGCLCLFRVNGDRGLIRIDGNSTARKFVDEDSGYRQSFETDENVEGKRWYHLY